jgi:hypothetical protein
MRRLANWLMAVVLLGAGSALGPVRAGVQGNCHTFAETGKAVCGRFLEYWTGHGGLAQQGFPISAEFPEVSEVNGKTYTVQYFERAVFEMHPENAAPNDVLLSLLGVSRYKQKYPGSASGQEPNTSAGSVLFPQTGKRLGGRFLVYWNGHGGLAQQGYPISDELTERSELDGKSYRVQYFERAVFEMHPENPVASEVLLSQLGTFQLKTRYAAGGLPPAPPAPPAPAPPGSAAGGQALTFSGTGEMKTKPFFLAAGSYVSEWTARDPSSGMVGGCFHSGFLESADGAVATYDLGSKIIFPGRGAEGTAPLLNLRAGQYLLNMTSGCSWTVKIKPQGG